MKADFPHATSLYVHMYETLYIYMLLRVFCHKYIISALVYTVVLRRSYFKIRAKLCKSVNWKVYSSLRSMK